MESVEWKAQRYDQLLQLGGEKLLAKVEGYDRLAGEVAALKWKAERYDELMEVAGEKALSRLRQYDALVGQLNEYRHKANEYSKLLKMKFQRFGARLDEVDANFSHKIGQYETLRSKVEALEWKAHRYDELVKIGGERVLAKLQNYDDLMAGRAAQSWKIRRYDALVELGGERAAAKLRAYDGLLEDVRRLKSEMREERQRVQIEAREERRQLQAEAREEQRRLRAEARAAMERLGNSASDSDAATAPYSAVIVLGAARTGTTLVGSFLAWAPECHALPQEAGPLLTAMQGCSRLFGASNRFMGDENRTAAEAATRTYLRLFFDSYHAQQQTPTIVFRSPALTRHFAQLADLIDFCPARYVVCVRDPRDTVVSLLDWHRRATEAGRNPILDEASPAAAAAFYMGYYNNVMTAKDGIDPAKLMFVRYEDAVRDAHAVAQRIGAFTDVDLNGFDPDAPWPDKSYDFQAEKSTNLAVTPLYGKPPSESQIGRFREQLTPEEVAQVEDICQPIFRAFGYVSTMADA